MDKECWSSIKTSGQPNSIGFHHDPLKTRQKNLAKASIFNDFRPISLRKAVKRLEKPVKRPAFSGEARRPGSVSPSRSPGTPSSARGAPSPCRTAAPLARRHESRPENQAEPPRNGRERMKTARNEWKTADNGAFLGRTLGAWRLSPAPRPVAQASRNPTPRGSARAKDSIISGPGPAPHVPRPFVSFPGFFHLFPYSFR